MTKPSYMSCVHLYELFFQALAQGVSPQFSSAHISKICSSIWHHNVFFYFFSFFFFLNFISTKRKEINFVVIVIRITC